ncbi:hypothetical protein D3C76_1277530 [compost metagenome]
MKGSTVPSNSATKPIIPALRASVACTSKAVATMAKSRSMAPPIRPIPENSAMSARPFCPPVTVPPTQASTRPMTMAMAEPCTRPKVRYFDITTDNHMIAPTTAKAVIRPLCSRAFSMIGHMFNDLQQGQPARGFRGWFQARAKARHGGCG